MQGPLLNWNRERERKVEGHFLEKEMREGVMGKNAIFFLWIEEVHEQRGGGSFGRWGRKERGGQRERGKRRGDRGDSIPLLSLSNGGVWRRRHGQP